MFKCAEIKGKISLFIDNELSVKEHAEFKSHIDTCDSCKADLEDVKMIVDLCGDLSDEEIPADFNRKLHNRLLIEKERQVSNNKILLIRFRYTKYIAAVAAVLLMVLVLKSPYDYIYRTSLQNGAKSTQSLSSAPSKEYTGANSANQAETKNDSGGVMKFAAAGSADGVKAEGAGNSDGTKVAGANEDFNDGINKSKSSSPESRIMSAADTQNASGEKNNTAAGSSSGNPEGMQIMADSAAASKNSGYAEGTQGSLKERSNKDVPLMAKSAATVTATDRSGAGREEPLTVDNVDISFSSIENTADTAQRIREFAEKYDIEFIETDSPANPPKQTPTAGTNAGGTPATGTNTDNIPATGINTASTPAAGTNSNGTTEAGANTVVTALPGVTADIVKITIKIPAAGYEVFLNDFKAVFKQYKVKYGDVIPVRMSDRITELTDQLNKTSKRIKEIENGAKELNKGELESLKTEKQNLINDISVIRKDSGYIFIHITIKG